MARRRGVHNGHQLGVSRWEVITINRSPEEVAPGGRLPGPLAEFGDAVEVRISPAPADRGTEIAGRWRQSSQFGTADGPNGEGDAQPLRSALRATRQLVEVGEVLVLEPQPAGKRSPLPTTTTLEAAARRVGRKGQL
ncbi:hypothetical protein ABZV93_08180 [Actinopolymorpha sp. NPDC004070]|uniref:hypothetical protein n=1 Tax=Actinopolymorpha sp. NPDC004070 TaxID=3154548 RepID=UPI0033BE3647